jgi:hypothetical protein
VPGRELTDFGAVNNENAFGRDDETIGAIPDTSVERSRDFVRAPDVVD